MPLSDVYAALRWWLALLLLGLAVLPLAYTLFGRLPDRGYAFTKMLGLLLVSYLTWIMGSLGFLGNNLGAILAALAAAAAGSLALYWRLARPSPDFAGGSRVALSTWLRHNWRQVVLTELLFAAMFALWAWVRAQNPAISATEKPMEFAFLNAVGRSEAFPPLDPWLSGYAISYYYFGYVMSSILAQLAFVPEPIAFNLAVAWLFAGTATGAYGLVYNLLASEGLRRSARGLALVAALALPLAGNLVIGLEIAHANGTGSPAFWSWLDVRELNGPPVVTEPARYESSNWWWWRSSRPLREVHLSGRPEDGLEPIAEFPAFSFVLGDLHPHVLALPFAFLSLAVALLWWLPQPRGPAAGTPLTGWDNLGWPARAQALLRYAGLPLWFFSALVLGGLAFLNTWDVLIHLFVFLGAFLLARWRDEGWHGRLLSQTLLLAFLLLIPAILLYLPFFLGFRSQAGAPYLLPMLMRPTRLAHFLLIFGMPLWAITVFVLALAARQRFRYWRTGLLTAVALLAGLLLLALLFAWIIAISPDGAGRVTALAGELGITLPPRPAQTFALGWGTSSLLALLPAYLSARITYPALMLLLAALAGLVVMIWRDQLQRDEAQPLPGYNSMLPFALLLVGTGALLTLGPEFVYLRDNFGARLNTVFKFYYQAWVMFGIAALYAIGYLWSVWEGRGRVAPFLATAGYGAALILALLFPFYAVNSRASEYRGPQTAENRLPATLDGLAQTARFNPDEHDALLWLRTAVPGAPVILEAVGGQYSGFGRVSAATGLPTVLGWAGHEYQWRGETPEPAERDPAVREIYTALDLNSVAALLDRYGVQYIYVGGLERDTYGPAGLDKFAQQLELAYSNNGVAIYRWQPR